MKYSLAALLVAAAFAAASTPASACGFFRCLDYALADDSYPPGQPRLDPSIAYVVAARDDRGLSLGGFYNDPFLALARVGPPPVSRYGRPLRRAY